MVIRIAGIDLEGAVELSQRKLVAFSEKIDVGEHAISSRRCRIQRRCFLRERFRTFELFLAELGPS
jgi:hypothetical protein